MNAGRSAWFIRRGLASGLAAVLLVGGVACASSDSSEEVTLMTHDSFELPDRLIGEFQERTGYELNIARSGDAGQLSSIVSLTPGSPKADAVFGIDNTFASRPIEAGALAPYVSPAADRGADEYAVPDHADLLTAVDRADVCVNVDETWFHNAGIEPPDGIDDLVDPRYQDLLVALDPATSSPGMAFLLSTVGRYRSGAFDYWRKLVDNGVQIVGGWSVAYNQEFSAGQGRGPRPIVVSYASSPAATPGTRAVLDGCFAQVEYAGVLRGARNVDGARKLVDFLLSPDVQAALPESMYVYPVQDDVPLPPDWRLRAPSPSWTVRMSPGFIDDHREEWLDKWREAVGR